MSGRKRIGKILVVGLGLVLAAVLVWRRLPADPSQSAARPAAVKPPPPTAPQFIYAKAKINKENAPQLPAPGAPWITDWTEEPDPRTTAQLRLCASDAKLAAERSSCWYELAHRDRAGAGRELARLSPASIDELMLGPLVEAYRAYPSQQSMEARLRELGLVPGDRAQLAPAAVTLTEALRRHKVIASFDAETGQFPNEHDDLLYELANMASGLEGVQFREQPPPVDNETTPYQLDAWLDGTHYRVAAQNLGDWFDLPAVVGLLNTLLGARKSEVRVLVLISDDQIAQLAIATRASLLRAVEAGVLRSENPDQARQAGKDFEERAIEQLQHGQ